MSDSVREQNQLFTERKITRMIRYAFVRNAAHSGMKKEKGRA